MARGEKFYRLSDHLHTSGSSKIALSFNDVEAILGEPLSPSAYKNPAYWTPSEAHTFPESWIKAGYRLTDLDLNRQCATWEINGTQVISVDRETFARSEPICSVKTHTSLTPEVATKKVMAYYQEVQSTENGRYKSWEHCYSYFSKQRYHY